MVGSPSDRERKPLKKWLSLAARVALTITVTWFILDRVGLTMAELRAWDDVLARPRPLPFAAATLLLLGTYAVTCLIWGRMVLEFGGPSLSPRDSVSIFMIANLGRYLPGKIWSIVGMAALARGKGVSVAISTTAAVVMQGVGLLAAGLIGLGAFARGPDSLPRWGMAGTGLAIAGLLLLVAVPGLFRRAVNLWFRVARTEPPRNLTAVAIVRWLLQVTAAWVAIGASFWLFAVSLGVELSPVHAGSAFAAAYVAGYLMLFAPAGVGVREGFLVVLLSPSLGAGPATVLAIAARLWMTAADVIPAGILWMYYPHPHPQSTADPTQG